MRCRQCRRSVWCGLGQILANREAATHWVRTDHRMIIVEQVNNPAALRVQEKMNAHATDK